MKQVLVILFVISGLAIEGAFIGVSFDTPWSIGALVGAVLAVYLLYKERVAAEMQNDGSHTATMRRAWQMWLETAYALFVLTLGGAVIAEFFGFSWALGTLIGILWIAVWFTRKYLFRRTLHGLVLEVRETAGRALSCLSNPDQRLRGLIGKLSCVLADLENLAKEGSPDAKMLADQIPPIGMGITNPDYLRVAVSQAYQTAENFLNHYPQDEGEDPKAWTRPLM